MMKHYLWAILLLFFPLSCPLMEAGKEEKVAEEISADTGYDSLHFWKGYHQIKNTMANGAPAYHYVTLKL